MLNIKNYIFNNYCLACALIAWIISQILKTIFVYVTERRFDFGRLFGAGGMPSAHSAAVVALTFAVRRQCGANSPIFAVNKTCSSGEIISNESKEIALAFHFSSRAISGM